MEAPTSPLGKWLQLELKRRNLSQIAAAMQAHVGVGTINQTIRGEHIPKLDTLFRLADFFGTPREKVLRLAAGMSPTAEESEEEDAWTREFLMAELVAAFREVPDEWKEEVLAQVQMFVRLANRPPVRIIGGEEGEDEGAEEETGKGAASRAA